MHEGLPLLRVSRGRLTYPSRPLVLTSPAMTTPRDRVHGEANLEVLYVDSTTRVLPVRFMIDGVTSPHLSPPDHGRHDRSVDSTACELQYPRA
jgi:hypothetical protein